MSPELVNRYRGAGGRAGIPPAPTEIESLPGVADESVLRQATALDCACAGHYLLPNVLPSAEHRSGIPGRIRGASSWKYFRSI
jgi:hypothetical protein